MRDKILLALISIIISLAFTSCVDFWKDADDVKYYNDFDFSTVNEDVNLEVCYHIGGVRASVYFELYGEMPVRKVGERYEKLFGVMPLYAAFTNEDGTFHKNVDLSGWLDKVWIYSPDFQSVTLIECEVVNGHIKASDIKAGSVSRATATTTTSYDSYMVMESEVPDEYAGKRWKTWLGDYDKYKNGEVGYKYTGSELMVDDYSALYSAHNQVINSKQSCPDEYRSYTDLEVQKEAEMAVTFLGQNTCWNCSLGYYYYKEGEEPSSLDDVDVIMLFPNTQDGQWENRYNSNNEDRAAASVGIERGTVVQLKYFPNIASGSREGETTKFPAGTRIGFVLATNAWQNRVTDFTAHKKYRAATSESLSVDNFGTPYNAPRTATYQYGDYIIISFEDHTDDQNFSDVVITMKANPVGAVTDVPVVDPESKRATTSILKGIYAYEDLWPAAGDYDMSDVLVRYVYEEEFFQNKIYSESFTFKTFRNYAVLTSGLAAKIVYTTKPESVICYRRNPGEEEFTETSFVYEADDMVYVMTDNVETEVNTEYRVKFVYNDDAPVEEGAYLVQPFIFRDTGAGRRLEVHIAKEKPTSRADMSLFGTVDDASDPSKGVYYIRYARQGGQDLYPFAFFLSGASEVDLAPMLDRANEGVDIIKLYPDYVNWVVSGGQTHTDWYKR